MDTVFVIKKSLLFPLRQTHEISLTCRVGLQQRNRAMPQMSWKFSLLLSRVSILTRDIDIANLSVCPSVRPFVRNVPVSDENGLTYRHSWTLPCISSLVPSVLHLSHGFQCSPTLNRQPCEGRLPLTSWWRYSSNMTVGQSSLISLAHHCYDWHPESRCG